MPLPCGSEVGSPKARGETPERKSPEPPSWMLGIGKTPQHCKKMTVEKP